MTAYAGPARIQLPTLQRVDLLPSLSFGAALALPLAFVAFWVWCQLAPLPSGGSSEAGLAAFAMGATRGVVCWALAGAVNFAGFVLGSAGAIVHPKQRGRVLAGAAAALNAAPHVLLVLAVLLGQL